MSFKKSGDPFAAVAFFCAIGVFFGIPTVWIVAPAGDALCLSVFMLLGYGTLLMVAKSFR
jgi:hypothetical protein